MNKKSIKLLEAIGNANLDGEKKEINYIFSDRRAQSVYILHEESDSTYTKPYNICLTVCGLDTEEWWGYPSEKELTSNYFRKCKRCFKGS